MPNKDAFWFSHDSNAHRGRKERNMSKHRLKTVQPYFDDVLNGKKTFEVRKNDRGFAVGDSLVLEEYVPMGEGYTGQAIIREVTYVLDSPEYCKPGYVVLGINNPTDARRLALTASIPLDRLETICAAEKDGRCVVLPCKKEPFDCQHCKHLRPSDITNRLFCSYHSEGENVYEVFANDCCSDFERAEAEAKEGK